MTDPMDTDPLTALIQAHVAGYKKGGAHALVAAINDHFATQQAEVTDLYLRIRQIAEAPAPPMPTAAFASIEFDFEMAEVCDAYASRCGEIAILWDKIHGKAHDLGLSDWVCEAAKKSALAAVAERRQHLDKANRFREIATESRIVGAPLAPDSTGWTPACRAILIAPLDGDKPNGPRFQYTCTLLSGHLGKHRDTHAGTQWPPGGQETPPAG